MKWEEVKPILAKNEFLDIFEIVYFFCNNNEGKDFEEIYGVLAVSVLNSE
jgi:hypothetical protein